MTIPAWSWRFVSLLLISVFAFHANAQQPRELPGTRLLDGDEADLSERLMDGAHQFVEKEIAEEIEKREIRWKFDEGQEEEALLQQKRDLLQTMLGMVEERKPPRLERYGDTFNPVLVAQTDELKIWQVRWPVVGNVFGYGLLVEPKDFEEQDEPKTIIAIPDADQFPEDLIGLTGKVPAYHEYARRLVTNGYRVLIPGIVLRTEIETDNPRRKQSQQTHREWIYRQAFHMGRTLIGYEVQSIMSAIDALKAEDEDCSISVCGIGEGGLLTLFSAACDPRIESIMIAGYPGNLDEVWREPIYRNIFGFSKEFGLAELVRLVQPRKIVFQSGYLPRVTGHKGTISEDSSQPGFEASLGELHESIEIVPWVDGPQPARPATTFLLASLSAFTGLPKDNFETIRERQPTERRKTVAPAMRHDEYVDQLETHIQELVRKSEHVRDDFFLYAADPDLTKASWNTNREVAIRSPERFIEASKTFREKFEHEIIGKFSAEVLPPNARTRKVAETDLWTAYDVVLDVHTDLIAWGVIVIPKGIKPDERRPVVVCQHGRNGIPRDTIDGGKTAYNDFAAKLAERGFITFAPHNLYRGEDRYRVLDRKANAIGCTLFSFIVAQHRQILIWLKEQPYVDADRIAFYGLSYGGETAVRVPAILEDYSLSICSGDFNQWTRKVAATDQPFSFMNTIEWEMPYWNLGQTFDYAEMSYLIFPRPFMVERGHLDLVGRDQWVAHEYAKTRWLYAQYGKSDLTEIEFFQGGHSINGVKSFEFLHKHLNWPEPSVK